MAISAEKERFLLQQKQDVQRELDELKHNKEKLAYHDLNERMVELNDELTQIENELVLLRDD